MNMPSPSARPGLARPRAIRVEPLTRAAFEPYGDVIDIDASASARVRAINQGSAARIDDLTTLDLTDADGRPCLAIFRTADMRWPLRLRLFERHRLGSQTFVPLADGRCLAVVAGSGGQPDEHDVRAFVTRPGQGFTLRRGVWHHPLITLGAATVLVIERSAAGREDCDTVAVHTPIELAAP